MLSRPLVFAPRARAQSTRHLVCVLENATIMPTFISTWRQQRSLTGTLCWSLLMEAARAIQKGPSMIALSKLRARLHLRTCMARVAKEAPASSSYVYWVVKPSLVSLLSIPKWWYRRRGATTMTLSAAVLVVLERPNLHLKFVSLTATTGACSKRSMFSVQPSKLLLTESGMGMSSALCLFTMVKFRLRIVFQRISAFG